MFRPLNLDEIQIILMQCLRFETSTLLSSTLKARINLSSSMFGTSREYAMTYQNTYRD